MFTIYKLCNSNFHFYPTHTSVYLPPHTPHPIYMNKITITGDLGSGKSVVSKLLCAATDFAYVSTGQIQRQLAHEMGLDTLEMNRRADTDPSIDERIDGIFTDLGLDPNGYVVDSRLAWFFLPMSLKIYLQTDPAESARRILHDPTRKSETYETAEEALAKLRARKQSENERFWIKYGADCTNLQLFDLVVDTTYRTPEQVAELILQAKRIKETGGWFGRYW